MRRIRLAFLITSGLLLVASAARGQSAAPAPDAEESSGRPSVRALRLERARPVVDGRLDEPFWTEATVATEFRQSRPDAGEPATQRTEARVAFDDDAIYVGMRMWDSAPDSIAAQLARRDASGILSDWAHVVVDSYHDRRTGFRFSVNPRGVQKDVLHFDDTEEDLGWDAVWEAAATVDEGGWTAELRIPLSQLRFAAGGGAGGPELVWGINFGREIARYEESAYWAPVLPDVQGYVSRAGELRGLRGLASPRRLEVLPYSVARLTRAPEEADDPFYTPNDLFGSVGADLKYGVTSNLTLTATINPDFGQVEADPSTVNLSAYESFYPERRPFFLEGGDLFRVGVGVGDGDMAGEQLFYSRRIGRAPRGSVPGDAVHGERPEAATILGAVKLTGKTAGGWSVGIFDAVTGAEEARYVTAEGAERSAVVEPATNYAVARVGRDFRGGRSSVGGILTAANRRIDTPALDFLNEAAYAGGVDVSHRFAGGDWVVDAALLGSHIRGSTAAISRAQRAPARYFQRPDAEHVEHDPTRTSLSGMASTLSVSKVAGGNWRGGVLGMMRTPGFEVNDLGYQREADALLQVVYAGYRQHRPGPLFRRWSLFTNQFAGWTFGRERTVTGANVNGNVQLHNLWSAYGGVNRQFSALSATRLRGGPAIRRPGGTNFWVGVNTDQREAVTYRLNVNGWFEDETDGRRLSLNPSVSVRAGSRLSLSLRPGVSWNRQAWQYVGEETAGDGAPRYLVGRLEQRTVSLTTRLSYTFTPTLSVQLYAQPFISAGDYSDLREVVEPRAATFDARFRPLADGTAAEPDFNFKQLRSNAVLRWEYRPGSTLYLVWSQGRTDFEADGRFALGRDAGRLLDAEGTNVLMLKLNYWLDI